LFGAPAAAQAFMSVTALAPLDDEADGPPGGMLPPYHVRREEFGSAHDAPPPFEYAALALL
jgi:hypothetical protein